MELNLPAILTPDLGLLFWMAIAFLVVFGVLAKFGFPAIIKMVDERKQYIDDSLRKAHEANEKLANIQKEGESILQEARERQAQILKEATATRDAIVEKAQEKARVPAKRQHMVYACSFERLTVFLKIRFGEADAGDVGDRVDPEFLLDEGGDLDGLSRTGATRAVGTAYKIGMQF